DVWRPLPVPSNRVLVIARLAPSASPAYLAAALDDVSRTSAPPARVVATDIATAVAGNAKTPLRLLASAAAVAIAIAFINLAGLLIVRLLDRRRELAIRSALGAQHSQIARQLLWEAVALVAIGTLAGVVLALWLT